MGSVVGSQTDVASAQASRESDRKAILHHIVGTRLSARDQDPPESHPNYIIFNEFLQRRFRSGMLYSYVAYGEVGKVEEFLRQFPEQVNAPFACGGRGLLVGSCTAGHVEV